MNLRPILSTHLTARPLKRMIPLLFIPFLMTSCIKAIESRGYTLEEKNVSQLQPLVNTKDDVTRVLGSPSSKSAFGRDTWYYISAKVERIAFLSGKTVEQHVVAIEFDETGKIISLNQYTLKDAQHVQFAKDATPAEGSDVSAVGQIIGNVGRFNPGGSSPAPRTSPHTPLP